MIKPTVGRVVLFHPQGQPETTVPALVCHVHSDTCVNLAAFDENGEKIPGTTSVTLVHEEGDWRPSYGYWCEWMPFQKGQAMKTEHLEKELAAK